MESRLALKDQYFDLRGLAAYSSLGASTLRDHINRGALPCFKVGGKLLFRKTEIDKWIESFRVKKGEALGKMVNEILEGLRRPNSDPHHS